MFRRPYKFDLVINMNVSISEIVCARLRLSTFKSLAHATLSSQIRHLVKLGPLPVGSVCFDVIRDSLGQVWLRPQNLNTQR